MSIETINNRLNSFIDQMHEDPTPYNIRVLEMRQAREEQFKPRQKRYVYRAQLEQFDPDHNIWGMISMGEYDFDTKDTRDLENWINEMIVEKKRQTKHPELIGTILLQFVRRRW